MEKEVLYVAKEAPNLRISGVNGKALLFKHGVLRLNVDTDAETIAALDELIGKKPNLSQLVRKVDKTAAEERLKAALAAEVAQRGTRAGGVTGESMAAITNLATRDQELLKHAAATGQDPKDVIDAAADATGGAITVSNQQVQQPAKHSLGNLLHK